MVVFEFLCMGDGPVPSEEENIVQKKRPDFFFWGGGSLVFLVVRILIEHKSKILWPVSYSLPVIFERYI